MLEGMSHKLGPAHPRCTRNVVETYAVPTYALDTTPRSTADNVSQWCSPGANTLDQAIGSQHQSPGPALVRPRVGSERRKFRHWLRKSSISCPTCCP